MLTLSQRSNKLAKLRFQINNQKDLNQFSAYMYTLPGQLSMLSCPKEIESNVYRVSKASLRRISSFFSLGANRSTYNETVILEVYRSETLQLLARKDADATRTQYVSSLSCSANVLSKILLWPCQFFTYHHFHHLAPALTTAARWRGRSFAALLD